VAPAMAALVQGLWAMLDEMADNDPSGYRRLLQQQREQAERFRAPPEPRLVLRARLAGARFGLSQGAAGAPIFINVCGWRRVPAPQSPAGPTPVLAGPLEEVRGEPDPYSVIDVAFNPAVLQRAEENPENMEHLIHLTLKFVEERCSLSLSRSYTLEPFKLKGSLEMMQRRLKGREALPPHLSQNTKELSLDQLLQAADAENCTNSPVLLKGESVTESKVPLIEEITSTEAPAEPSTPVYEMRVVKDANERPLQLELRIELPEVSSVSECDLRISKDDLVIEVPAKYKLQLDLPELVDEDTTTAAFNKGKRLLCVTAPVARPG
ncbi:PIHD2 protein, partial [Upupa epops]|nr:PIHD2 protein [Upupa epops]